VGVGAVLFVGYLCLDWIWCGSAGVGRCCLDSIVVIYLPVDI